ncbi:hypothetical protein [Desulfonatronum parangueonense]
MADNPQLLRTAMPILAASPTHQAPPCSPDDNPCPRAHSVPILLMVLLVGVIYANSFSGAWVFDDDPNIVLNANVHMQTLEWKTIKATFYGITGEKVNRPLAYLSFGLNHFVHGLDVFGYHLVNLLIHCTTAIFLYLWVFHTLRLPRLREDYGQHAASIALLAAVLWATSPIQVTAVTYIVQRMASMAGMFFIMAMYCYTLARTYSVRNSWDRTRQVGLFGLCGLAFALSLASKENAVMLPVVLYLYDLLLIQGATRNNLLRHLRWGAIPAAICIGIALLHTNPLNWHQGYANRPFDMAERLMTQPRVLVFYISLMLYPATERFTFVHDVLESTSLLTPWTTTPAILILFAAAIFAILQIRKRPLVSFCILFFLVNHLVESSFIALEMIFEHRNYIPSMAVFLLVAVGIWRVLQMLPRLRVRLLIVAALCFVLFAQSHTVILRNELFHYPLMLWDDNVQKAPNSSRAYTNLGKAYWELGMPEEAMQAHARAMELDRYQNARNRGVPLLTTGQYYLQTRNDPQTAIRYLREGLDIFPQYWPGWLYLATSLVLLGEDGAAEEILQDTLVTWPNNVHLGTLHALILLRLNKIDTSMEAAYRVLSRHNNISLAHSVLGAAWMEKGNVQQARKHWSTAATLATEDPLPRLALLLLAWGIDDQSNLVRHAAWLANAKGEMSWVAALDEWQQPDSIQAPLQADTIIHLAAIHKGLLLSLPALNQHGRALPDLLQEVEQTQ